MTQTAPPSNRSTYLTNASGWNAHSMIFRRRNAVPRIGERQRQVVAERHADLKRKRRDFLHKLSNYYATEYDLVAVEGLDAKELVELPRNSRNRAGAAWGTFLRMLEYKCEREGTHFAEVDPGNTTKACASCGVKTDKPLWVREHSCPSCGFEADRGRERSVEHSFSRS